MILKRRCFNHCASEMSNYHIIYYVDYNILYDVENVAVYAEFQWDDKK